MELACGQWMDILSINWEASGLAKQICAALQKDYSDALATESLKASLGVKSPSTLLKRADAMKRYIR